MEVDGFVISAKNPAHRRSPLLHLSEKGRNALRTIDEKEASRLERLGSTVDTKDLKTALVALQQVRQALENEAKPLAEELTIAATDTATAEETELPYNLL
jgi:DNA-binding MarR family transcriptional regulator